MGQANKNRTRESQLQICGKLLTQNIRADLEAQLAQKQDSNLLKLLKEGVIAEVRSEKEVDKLLV
jgi:hypothetical protein